MVDDGLRAEGADAADRLHNLLLVLTGRVDDEAVNSVRELLGTGQVDAAAEFLAGCLLAGRIPVTSTEQYHLRRVLDEARSQYVLADRLHVVDSVSEQTHRFSEPAEPDTDLVEALGPVTARLTGVRAVWCTSRVTPSGVTYGAVPRRVLLAEVGNDGSVSAAGYQLLEALRRAGVSCSVDAFTSGADLPEYHRNALASARRVHLDMPTVQQSQNGSNHARAPRASSGGEPAKAEPSIEPEPAEKPKSEPITESAVPEVSSEPAKEPVGEGTPKEKAKQTGSKSRQSGEGKQSGGESGSNNMRVPAAVDAKLTDRERNLLRKLHEELAQREHDRGGKGEEQAVTSRVGQEDSFSTTPGTGGFPPAQK